MTAGGTVTDRRRGKAALFVMGCGFAGIAPHWLGPVRSLLPAMTLGLLLAGYSLRTLRAAALRRQSPDPRHSAAAASAAASAAVDVVVAARDEQAVIERLVQRIAGLRYPSGLLRIWIIDDGSEDDTPKLLAQLQTRYPQLRVLRRHRNAGGGKSGALNRVLRELQGRWLLVLDADADLQSDLLERLIPFAEAGGWAAVQLRKAEVNSGVNLLTRAQAMEMALDAMVQEGRLATGGVVELRGNGQLLRRDAMATAGGFNEATVTDDLDLSFRFLLAGLPIGLLWDPPVQEEAVLTLPALWRQRQRWAEGGLQRFFDYWPQLLSDRVSTNQKVDLASFFLLQYALPVVASADLMASLITRTIPTVWPLSLLATSLMGVAMVTGCRRPSEGPPLPSTTPLATALGILYLMHWFVVIPWVTMRMALQPKRLVWAKTTHLGAGPAQAHSAPEGMEAGTPGEAEPELAAEL